MIWTSALAVLLGWIQVLTYYSNKHFGFELVQPMHEAVLGTLVALTPEFAIALICSMAIVLAWSGRWWMPILALVAAIGFDFYGHVLFRWLYLYFERPRFIRTFAVADWGYYASYNVVGRNLMIWLTFGAAKLLGVQFRRHERYERKHVE